GESLGSATGRQCLVPQDALADALSIFPADATAALEGDHHARSLVCSESGLRSRLRCDGGVFVRLAGTSLPCVFVLLFDRPASGRRALDPGALYERRRSGNFQLLRADQSALFKHGLSQRAPRSPFDSVE